MLEAQFADFFVNLDWDRYKANDGTVDPEKVVADRQLQAAAGDMYPRVLDAVARMRVVQLQSKGVLESLPHEERAELISVICALQQEHAVVSDQPAGRRNVRKALQGWASGASQQAQWIARYFGQIPDHSPPGKLLQGLQSFLELTVLTGNSQGQRESNELSVYGKMLMDWIPAHGALSN